MCSILKRNKIQMTTLKYVTIDSRNRIEIEKTSKMTVHLSHPIHSAKSVSMISLSTPNEIYNIRDKYNTFKIQVYSTTGNVGTAMYEYEIIPGLYTMQALVDACNAAITAGTSIVGATVIFTLLANYRVEMTTNNTSSYPKYVALYHSYKDNFYKSVIYRMGFSRKQVARGKDNVMNINNSILQITFGAVTQPYSTFKTFNIMYANNNEKLIGNFICYESPTSFLQIRSNLVHDNCSTVSNEDNTLCQTKNDDIMQNIPISVNVFSYIHFQTSPADSVKHSLSHSTISSFTLSLTDDLGHVFEEDHFKDFVCTLCFEIENDISLENLNREVLLANQKSQFLSRHSYK
jgi:hypothetical protein